jgi:hypothetical protein
VINASRSRGLGGRRAHINPRLPRGYLQAIATNREWNSVSACSALLGLIQQKGKVYTVHDICETILTARTDLGQEELAV